MRFANRTGCTTEINVFTIRCWRFKPIRAHRKASLLSLCDPTQASNLMFEILYVSIPEKLVKGDVDRCCQINDSSLYQRRKDTLYTRTTAETKASHLGGFWPATHSIAKFQHKFTHRTWDPGLRGVRGAIVRKQGREPLLCRSI